MPKGVYERTDAHRAINRKHGACSRNTRTPEYRAWRQMKSRCLNQANKDYPNYGGRGIAICSRWLHDYESFLADMGPRPSPKHSIDRIDGDGPYAPENCRWATPTEQVRNRSCSRTLTVNGETLPVIEWANRLGLKYQTLLGRLKRMSPAEAVAAPFGRKAGHRLTSEEARRIGGIRRRKPNESEAA